MGCGETGVAELRDREVGREVDIHQRSHEAMLPREKSGVFATVIAQGTETVACDQFAGDPKGKWSCHYDAVACTARPRLRRSISGRRPE